MTDTRTHLEVAQSLSVAQRRSLAELQRSRWIDREDLHTRAQTLRVLEREGLIEHQTLPCVPARRVAGLELNFVHMFRLTRRGLKVQRVLDLVST